MHWSPISPRRTPRKSNGESDRGGYNTTSPDLWIESAHFEFCTRSCWQRRTAEDSDRIEVSNGSKRAGRVRVFSSADRRIFVAENPSATRFPLGRIHLVQRLVSPTRRDGNVYSPTATTFDQRNRQGRARGESSLIDMPASLTVVTVSFGYSDLPLTLSAFPI